jgi:hypothetical protein
MSSDSDEFHTKWVIFTVLFGFIIIAVVVVLIVELNLPTSVPIITETPIIPASSAKYGRVHIIHPKKELVH